MNDKKVMFVSGHLDLTQDEFNTHYVPRIEAAIAEGCRFIVGDAKGADAMTQEYLFKRGVPCPIFHMFESPRNNYAGIGALRGGYKSDAERDEAMTQASHDDIAWVRPGKRPNSGTEKNLQRRVEYRKHARAVEIASWPLREWGEREIWPHYFTSEPTKDAGMNDDGSPVAIDASLHDHVHVPQDLIDRMKKAWSEYSQCQHEFEQLLREQGKWR